MSLAELPSILDVARDRLEIVAEAPVAWHPTELVPIRVSVHDLPHRSLSDLLDEEERLALRAARTVLPAADAVRLRAVAGEIDARWAVFLERSK